jgi:protoporphyrin/coproporphyrin ferrochelatase
VRRAVLLVSHGTIDNLDDLPEFVSRIRRGSAPTPELVRELRSHYEAIGGQSPVNRITAQLAQQVEERLGLTVGWANRLWKPFVRDVLGQLVRGGAQRVAVVPLAQHSAHVYAEDARRAAQGLGVRVACAANWGHHPKLNEAFATRIAAAHGIDPRVPATTVLMTAHSLPQEVLARGDPYEREVRAAAEQIAARVRARLGAPLRHVVAFQSQGFGGRGKDGKPIEWLGPDLRAALDELAGHGDKRVVFAPIGFLADHVETLYDLDVEARAMAEGRGLQYVRAASLNADEDLVDALVDVAQTLLGDG